MAKVNYTDIMNQKTLEGIEKQLTIMNQLTIAKELFETEVMTEEEYVDMLKITRALYFKS